MFWEKPKKQKLRQDDFTAGKKRLKFRLCWLLSETPSA